MWLLRLHLRHRHRPLNLASNPHYYGSRGWRALRQCNFCKLISFYTIPTLADREVRASLHTFTSKDEGLSLRICSLVSLPRLIYRSELMNYSNSAIAAAISLACSKAIDDPYLIYPWIALAVATFLCAMLFPTYFKHLNIPMQSFADKDRMAGKDQPMAILDKKGQGEES